MGRGLDGYFDIRALALCGFEGPGRGWSRPVSGGYGEGETPLPIPNRAVKPLSADGTWLARAWESRSPPVFSISRCDSAERADAGRDQVLSRQSAGFRSAGHLRRPRSGDVHRRPRRTRRRPVGSDDGRAKRGNHGRPRNADRPTRGVSRRLRALRAPLRPANHASGPSNRPASRPRQRLARPPTAAAYANSGAQWH